VERPEESDVATEEGQEGSDARTIRIGIIGV